MNSCIFAPSLAAGFSNWQHWLYVPARVYGRDRENMKLLLQPQQKC